MKKDIKNLHKNILHVVNLLFKFKEGLTRHKMESFLTDEKDIDVGHAILILRNAGHLDANPTNFKFTLNDYFYNHSKELKND